MRLVFALITAVAYLLGGSVVAQDRLPPYIRSNTYVAGQLFGCAIRFETYYQRTVDLARQFGREPRPTTR